MNTARVAVRKPVIGSKDPRTLSFLTESPHHQCQHYPSGHYSHPIIGDHSESWELPHKPGPPIHTTPHSERTLALGSTNAEEEPVIPDSEVLGPSLAGASALTPVPSPAKTSLPETSDLVNTTTSSDSSEGTSPSNSPLLVKPDLSILTGSSPSAGPPRGIDSQTSQNEVVILASTAVTTT